MWLLLVLSTLSESLWETEFPSDGLNEEALIMDYL